MYSNTAQLKAIVLHATIYRGEILVLILSEVRSHDLFSRLGLALIWLLSQLRANSSLLDSRINRPISLTLIMTRPTGHKLAPTTLQAVLNRIDAGVNNPKIYEQTGVSQRCTAKIRVNLQQWGQPYAPPCVKRGRPSTLRDIHRRRLREYLNGRPQAYLEEIRDWLLDEFDIPVSIKLVHRELEKMEWSRKIATKKASEQSDALRQVFQARVQLNYTAEQVVAIDKSACNERTGDRKYG
jgi:transposase